MSTALQTRTADEALVDWDDDDEEVLPPPPDLEKLDLSSLFYEYSSETSSMKMTEAFYRASLNTVEHDDCEWNMDERRADSRQKLALIESEIAIRVSSSTTQELFDAFRVRLDNLKWRKQQRNDPKVEYPPPESLDESDRYAIEILQAELKRRR